MNNMFNTTPIGGYSTQPMSSFANTWNARSGEPIRVNGLESVKAYPMIPNSKVILFDANEDIFYSKETDVSNYPTIRTFRFEELKTPEAESSEYVTLNEFNKFKEEVLNGQQHIRSLINQSTDGTNRTTSEDNDEQSGAKSKSTANASKFNKPKPSIQLLDEPY